MAARLDASTQTMAWFLRGVVGGTAAVNKVKAFEKRARTANQMTL